MTSETCIASRQESRKAALNFPRDLINAFGINADAGAWHYINNGAQAGRSTELFDAEQYLNNYADLQAAFGDNIDAATRHYIQYGANNGRTDDALTPFSTDEMLF